MSALSLTYVRIPAHQASDEQMAVQALSLSSESYLKKKLRDHLDARKKRSVRFGQLWGFYGRIRRHSHQRSLEMDGPWLTATRLHGLMPRRDDRKKMHHDTCKAWRDLLEDAGLLEQRHGAARPKEPTWWEDQNQIRSDLKKPIFLDKRAQIAQQVKVARSAAIYSTPRPPQIRDVPLHQATRRLAALKARDPRGRFTPQLAPKPPQDTQICVVQPLRPPARLPAPTLPPPPAQLHAPARMGNDPEYDAEKAERRQEGLPDKAPCMSQCSEDVAKILQLVPRAPRQIEQPGCILAEVQGRQVWLDARFLRAAKISTMTLTRAVGRLDMAGHAIEGDLARRIVAYAREIRADELRTGKPSPRCPNEAFAARELAPAFFAKHGLGGRRWLVEDA